ncbi:conserved hypothetical protein [delta proteobacterium NaphS2]|nr:conserved hypothetical protein [delta proteobacterium NaphS2]
MQIDFHHTATYVIARYAGFSHREADIIAYCSQYVDDATNTGTIVFDNRAMYERVASAHRMLDYSNFVELANHQVWIPFHFLPGNGGLPAGENPGEKFINKIVCKPNSYVAQQMVADCIREQETPYGLYRLGITMHVYADTWAHQGFAGVQHEINSITALDDNDNEDTAFLGRLRSSFGDWVESVASSFVGDALPLGHGAALSHPDKPYLSWSYRDNSGKIVRRNNTDIFTEAADYMCRAMQRYRVRNPDAGVDGLKDQQKQKLRQMFASTLDESGDVRHEKWIKAIAAGYFGFPDQPIRYRSKGAGSWKYLAIGTRRKKDKKSDRFVYDPSFMASDWKLFHDALQVHRLTVIRDILPRYGICAA